jgi:hypothetical protein
MTASSQKRLTRILRSPGTTRDPAVEQNEEFSTHLGM